MLGPDVHVFLLDMRGPPEFESSGEFVGNYLGKEQSMWLESSLRSSNSLWKVVMSGHSLAMVLNETEYIEATESNLPQPTSVEEKITDTLEDKEVEESKETNTAEKSLREESEIEDLVKDKAAESVATISKQVSLHLPDPIHTAKDVQLDETTGYLKYSLQHVLASVEAKLPSASRENFLESDAPVDHMLLVSSGILVISAGSVAKRKNVVYTMKESGSAKDYGIEPNDSHSVATTICPHDRSCLAPAFLCGYRTLTFSTGQYTSRTANTQATTASNEKKKNNADNDFYYCAEIGLGPSIQETRSVATSQNSSFDFQTTIVGDLLYQKSCADSLDALTTAKLLLLPDGTLQVDLLELPVSMNATNSACTISTPVPEAHFGKLISRIKCVAPSQKQEEVE